MRCDRTIYQFEDYFVDSGRIGLRKNGAILRIAPTLFQLLLALLERAGRIVSHDELIASVWPARNIDEATVGRNVSELRRVLGGSVRNPRFIETFPRSGYRFSSTVRHLPFRGEAYDALRIFLSSIQEIELDPNTLSELLNTPLHEVETRLRQLVS